MEMDHQDDGRAAMAADQIETDNDALASLLMLAQSSTAEGPFASAYSSQPPPQAPPPPPLPPQPQPQAQVQQQFHQMQRQAQHHQQQQPVAAQQMHHHPHHQLVQMQAMPPSSSHQQQLPQHSQQHQHPHQQQQVQQQQVQRRYPLSHPQQPGGVVGGQSICLDDLRKYFHLPIAEVARQFNTCTTALKKVCRRLAINKWPYRQILSLTKSIQSLEMASLNEGLEDDLRQQYRKQISVLRRTIAEVVRNPSKIVVNESLSRIADEADDDSEGVGGGGGAEAAAEGGDDNVTQVIMAAAALMAGGGGGGDKRAKHRTPVPASAPAPLPVPSEQLLGKRARDDAAAEQAPSSSSGQQQAQAPSSSSAAAAAVLMGINGHGALPDIGSTSVRYNAMYDNGKNQFLGPVQLAPLQRRKHQHQQMRGSSNSSSSSSNQGKVVPLMEPDIGSQFHIEFTPVFIMSLLHKSLVDKHAVAPQGPYTFPHGQPLQGHGHAHGRAALMPMHQQQQQHVSPQDQSNGYAHHSQQAQGFFPSGSLPGRQMPSSSSGGSPSGSSSSSSGHGGSRHQRQQHHAQQQATMSHGIGGSSNSLGGLAGINNVQIVDMHSADSSSGGMGQAHGQGQGGGYGGQQQQQQMHQHGHHHHPPSGGMYYHQQQPEHR